MVKTDEYQYLNLARELLEKGQAKDDRTGVGTISKFGHLMRFDLEKGFPLLTTKKVNFNYQMKKLNLP